MNELKLCKTTVVRTLLPLAAVLVFFLVLLAAKALSAEAAAAKTAKSSIRASPVKTAIRLTTLLSGATADDFSRCCLMR